MKKILALVLLSALVMPLTVLPAFAEEAGVTIVKNVGNKLCPVTGDPVSGQYFGTHEGKRYGFCCPACPKTFFEDPEKYIAKMKEQEPDLANEVSTEAGSSNKM